MKQSRECRTLTIPPDARLSLDYDLDDQAIEGQSFAARFVVEIRDLESGEKNRLLEDEVRSDDGELLHVLNSSLAEYAYSRVDFCLDAQPLVANDLVSGDVAITWGIPAIRARSVARQGAAPTLSKEEQELRERQLRTLGYIE